MVAHVPSPPFHTLTMHPHLALTVTPIIISIYPYHSLDPSLYTITTHSITPRYHTLTNYTCLCYHTLITHLLYPSLPHPHHPPTVPLTLLPHHPPTATPYYNTLITHLPLAHSLYSHYYYTHTHTHTLTHTYVPQCIPTILIPNHTLSLHHHTPHPLSSTLPHITPPPPTCTTLPKGKGVKITKSSYIHIIGLWC